jgi:hypothetical protein
MTGGQLGQIRCASELKKRKDDKTKINKVINDKFRNDPVLSLINRIIISKV